jgi:hypothetical protein
VAVKVVGITVQIVHLYLILEKGFPLVLVATFTGILTMNAIVSSMVIFQRNKQMGLLEMLIDAMYVQFKDRTPGSFSHGNSD